MPKKQWLEMTDVEKLAEIIQQRRDAQFGHNPPNSQVYCRDVGFLLRMTGYDEVEAAVGEPTRDHTGSVTKEEKEAFAARLVDARAKWLGSVSMVGKDLALSMPKPSPKEEPLTPEKMKEIIAFAEKHGYGAVHPGGNAPAPLGMEVKEDCK
jgi:hypothetical protein